MEVKELLKMQKELDKLIFKNSNIKEYPISKIRLALLTEVGELANEVQSFKYWKHNKNIKREKILEEWADCFHFALSLENELNSFAIYIGDCTLLEFIKQCDEELYKIDVDKDTFNDLIFLTTFKTLISTVSSPLAQILMLGYRLDITPNEMEKAYKAKYKKNIQRQKDNY